MTTITGSSARLAYFEMTDNVITYWLHGEPEQYYVEYCEDLGSFAGSGLETKAVDDMPNDELDKTATSEYLTRYYDVGYILLRSGDVNQRLSIYCIHSTSREFGITVVSKDGYVDKTYGSYGDENQLIEDFWDWFDGYVNDEGNNP
jgi:hypothetical protein